MQVTDRPCAVKGLTSYRYAGNYGWIMIGAKDHQEALREAKRSISTGIPVIDKLQVWDGSKYKNAEA